jgi:hypothetical protein
MLPCERLDVELETARNKYGPHVGFLVVQSITDDGKSGMGSLINKYDDDCPPSKSDLESGQGDQFRCIFWTDARAAAVERVRQLLLDDYEQMQMQYNDHEDHDRYGGDGGDNVKATNEEETFQRQPGNNFAYCVADAYHAQFQPLLGQGVQDQRHDETLNLLFAVTYWLHHYHAGWLTNYEVATDLLASLAGHWRRLLLDGTVAALDLGILEPFTLPGLYAFLAQFQVLVKRVETHREPPLVFQFDHDNNNNNDDEHHAA